MSNLTIKALEDEIERLKKQLVTVSEAAGARYEAVADENWRLREQLVKMREALEFARRRIVYYGCFVERRHFDHDLAEVLPKIDAALTDEQQASCPHGMPNRERCSACNSY